MYKHILITTDGSELAQKGVDHGLSLAKSLGQLGDLDQRRAHRSSPTTRIRVPGSNCSSPEAINLSDG